MTLKEAEEFFKKYDGHAFHMGREEYDMYREFNHMDIVESTKEQWRQEIIDGYIGRIKNGDVVSMTNFGLIDTVSALVRRIFDIIKNTENCDMMVKFGLGEKMNQVFEKIADFPITEEDKTVSTGYMTIPERYERAVKKHREMYK